MAEPTPEAQESFHTRIQSYIARAEQFMKLPPHSIAATIDETDFVFVIKLCGVFEPLLRQTVRGIVEKAFTYSKVTPNKSEALVKLAGGANIRDLRTILFQFGHIDKLSNEFIEALFVVRNQYAHNIANAHLSISEVCKKVEDGKKTEELLSKLLHRTDTGMTEPLTDETVRTMIYFLVGILLKQLLLIVEPVPVPHEGELAKLMALGAEDSDYVVLPKDMKYGA